MAQITITGNVSKELKKLENKLTDMTPVFKDIADYEWSQTRLRYTREQDPNGKKWPDPFTIRRNGGTNAGRRSQEEAWGYVLASNYHAAPPGYHFFDAARGDKIMRDTGTLFSSIGRAYGKDYAIVGTNIEYAVDNQNGTGSRQARPFLGINKKTYDNVKKVVEFYLMGASR